ncbi:MAG: VanW family protein [Clostridia bacterium]|nr:VanW family protein [Clostridia bacterium]
MSLSASAKSSKGMLALIIFSVILVVLVAAIAAITIVSSGSDTILNGVTVGGIDLSGLTADEAEGVLLSRINEVKDEKITIKAGSDVLEAAYSEFGADYDCRLSAENAYRYGHEGFFSSIIPSVKSFFGIEAKQDLAVYINSRVFDETMSSFTEYDNSVQATYELTEDAIIVTNGKSAHTINPVTARETLAEAMKNLDFSSVTFEIEYIDPIPLDIEFLSEKYSEEAVSATYYRDSEGNIKVTDGNDKITVDLTRATELIAQHSAPGETFRIPATVEFAKYTRDELEEALFRDVLGTYTTSYSSSNANRSHNVALAASSCNEKILLPGEIFSYNETLGRRTAEAGYKMAGAYLNGETVQEYGGGICQVSSTLYISVLKANLKIEERLCHMFRVAYVPMGLDATVDYGTVDFKFSNDTDFPIKVVAYTTPSKQVTCEIVGTKAENFEVSFETTGVSAVPFPTEIIEDPTLPLGEEVIEEKGSDGSRCTTYRIVKVDGEVKSRTQESTSYYMPHKEVKRVGTNAELLPAEGTDPNAPVTEAPEAGTPAVSTPSAVTPVAPEASTPAVSETPAVPEASTPAVSETPAVPEVSAPVTEAPPVSEL